MAAGFISKRENASNTEVRLLLSHHFCLILFIRSKSQGPAHTQREGITQGYEYQEAAIIEIHVRKLPIPEPTTDNKGIRTGSDQSGSPHPWSWSQVPKSQGYHIIVGRSRG